MTSVTSETSAKETVLNIQSEILNARGDRVWDDYVNALKLIAQVVFTRGSGFILELLQNAEDAAQKNKMQCSFDIMLEPNRVVIRHDASAFSPEDVRAICGIQSSKKPENGTLGYLGIGFKSVFRVSDAPQIFSGPYQFEFKRDNWPDPQHTPWHVIPNWIENSPPRDPSSTTFVIPFREEGMANIITEELEQIKAELFLFLKYVKQISIKDSVTGTQWSVVNKGEDADGIAELEERGALRRLKVFRKVIDVPKDVRADRLTQELRLNVTQREIAIAFPLDEEGNLVPSKAGAMLGGIYSFVPVTESSSGAQFPIQADFLVQPGRDALNCEAVWNHWLVKEIATQCTEVITFLKSHPTWKFQFNPLFDFSESPGTESFDKLFGPNLIQPLQEELTNNGSIPTVDGGWASPNKSVIIEEDSKSIRDCLVMGVLSSAEMAPAFGGAEDLKQAASRMIPSKTRLVRTVDRRDLLRNDAFLGEKAGQSDAPEWFQRLYRWLKNNPIHILTRQNRRRIGDVDYRTSWIGRDRRSYPTTIEPYHDYSFVLDESAKLHRGGAVYLANSTVTLSPELRDQYPLLHPEVLIGTSEEEEEMRGFLTGYAGVQTLDTRRITRDYILPQIRTYASEKPSRDSIVELTTACHKNLNNWEIRNERIWVLTTAGVLRSSNEVVFSNQFHVPENWDTTPSYVAGLNFLSPKYVAEASDAEIDQWRGFFEAVGVRSRPESGIEEFAVSFAKAELHQFRELRTVESKNYGYDLTGEDSTGTDIYIEVKGQSRSSDILLTPNETTAAEQYKENFYLCVVDGIPNAPLLYLVCDPRSVGRSDTLTIPTTVWKTRRQLE